MGESINEPKARDMIKGRKSSAIMAPRNDDLDERKFEKMLAHWNSPALQLPKLNLVIKPKKFDSGGSRKRSERR